MADESKTTEEVILTQLIRLNAVIQGLVTGLVAGLGIFVATIWLVIKGGPVVGPHLSLLGQFFPGYRVTIAGSIVGFFWFFVTGFILGFAISYLYNWIVDLKFGKRTERVQTTLIQRPEERPRVVGRNPPRVREEKVPAGESTLAD